MVARGALPLRCINQWSGCAALGIVRIRAGRQSCTKLRVRRLQAIAAAGIEVLGRARRGSARQLSTAQRWIEPASASFGETLRLCGIAAVLQRMLRNSEYWAPSCGGAPHCGEACHSLCPLARYANAKWMVFTTAVLQIISARLGHGTIKPPLLGMKAGGATGRDSLVQNKPVTHVVGSAKATRDRWRQKLRSIRSAHACAEQGPPGSEPRNVRPRGRLRHPGAQAAPSPISRSNKRTTVLLGIGPQIQWSPRRAEASSSDAERTKLARRQAASNGP